MMTHQEQLAIKLIDEWLGYRLRYMSLPGFQVCVRKKGNMIFSKAYGCANEKEGILLTTDHLFHIASHSKTFTSCLFLQLESMGRVQLNSLIVDYIPELKKHTDKRFKKITIRDLLTHRSGIFRDGIDAIFWELQKPFLSREELLQETLSTPLIYEPNTETKYSNIGFGLLGIILENLMQMPYAAIVQEMILSKLPDCKIQPDYSGKEAKFADGHTRAYFNGQRRVMKHAAAQSLAAATGFCANAEGASLFFHELLLGKKLLTERAQRELLSLSWYMKNSKTERYGLGLQFDGEDLQLVGHSGAYPGFITQTRLIAGTDYVISFFLNTNEFIPSDAVQGIDGILRKIKESFTNAEAEKAILTAPMMNKYGAGIHVLSGKNALCFALESWTPHTLCLVFEKQKQGDYICHKESGYGSVGEKIIYQKSREGMIESVKWGSFIYHPEKIFLEKLESALDE